MMKNNYDPIATRYDWLSRIVFRQNLVLSQTCLLQHIPPQSSVLIVGGGTGWILSELTKTQATGLKITYIEISEKMINLAKKYDTGKNKVEFVHTAIENYTSNKTFDIILTAFLFDNFREEKVNLVFNKLARLLSADGKWLFADFHIDDKKSHWWQRVLLNSMLFFFRIICQIEARHLFPVKMVFDSNNFREMYSYEHLHGFIRSSVYVRATGG